MSDRKSDIADENDKTLSVDAVISEKVDADEYIKRLLPAHSEHQKYFSRLWVFSLALIFVTAMIQIPEAGTHSASQPVLFGVPLPLKTYLYTVLVFLIFFSVPYSAARLRSSETHNLITALSILQGNNKKPFLIKIRVGDTPKQKLTKHKYVTALMDGGVHSVKAISDNASPFFRSASRIANKYIIHFAICFLPVIGIVVTVAKLYAAINETNGCGIGSHLVLKISDCATDRYPAVDYFVDMNGPQMFFTFLIAIGFFLAVAYCWNAYRSILLGINIQTSGPRLKVWSHHPTLRYLKKKFR
ncbi:hypothetical protein [Hoeflea poritis]|uniref:RDD domain-containing protein n=1 Tax=Hoeflea poritis TaxID=2993659 RepID=A0ABT4VGD1_9HYPH|nr:hypothetical protein [Hoeflea poritis]MDA4843756.1 hypothetical protein [Hoeflea poritis]